MENMYLEVIKICYLHLFRNLKEKYLLGDLGLNGAEQNGP